MQMKLSYVLPLVAIFAAGPEGAPAQTLDTTTFVVMGEGLAAGMANFGLSSVMQNQDFAALMAAQMGTGMEQAGTTQENQVSDRIYLGTVSQISTPNHC